MKGKKKHFYQSALSLLLVLCMVLTMIPSTAMAADKKKEEKTIVYASIGDSMTNGYCLEGYDGTSGGINYGIETYSNMFAAWLAGYEGEVEDNQVIFKGEKATVDHRPLAISGMRAQDIQWVMELDYKNEELMKDLYANEYNVSSWNEDLWYNKWGFSGDYRTWADFCDSDFRYGDAAARLLAVYNTGDNDQYFKSSYADENTIATAKNGIDADPYFPQGRGQADSIGGYKYFQIATEYYQKSMADADVISMAVGNTNFGTFMLTEILDVVMSDDTSFANRYKLDKVLAQVADDEFVMGKVEEMLASPEYAKSVAVCRALASGDESKADRIENILKYCMASYVVGYIGMFEAIMEANPDVDIIQHALMNAYEQKDGTVEKDTLGELVQIIYTPANQFLKTLPEEWLASKSAEEQSKYEQARFYFAETDYVSCMVDVFGDDYYKENNSFIKYPGLLKGDEDYEANTASIVRARFVEEIVCGDMIFNAMGLRKENTQENIQNFLQGAIEYDMMPPIEKAIYAAIDSNAAKEYALYLGFENALIRSGTSNVTIDALANLSNIGAAFAEIQGPMMGEIGVRRADHYEPAAAVVAAGSNDALTQEQILQMMAAVEELEAQVWNGYADYHGYIEAQTGHTNLEQMIYCDTCKSGDAHGSEIGQKVMATYKEQMELLTYNIVAEQAKGQTNGMLNGADIKRLCEAENYENEVYALIAEKSNGQVTAEQVKTLAQEDENDGYDGVFEVANEITKQSTGTDYGASTIRAAYENNIILTEEQRGQIEQLMSVSDSTKALLKSEDTFKNGVSGINTAIDAASSLAYLLALPQTISDVLYEDKDMRGALCMNARCLLGTGAGGHPAAGGHESLYASMIREYPGIEEAHVHEFEEKVTKATTKKSGKIEEICECGEVGSTKKIYYPKTIKLSKTDYRYDGKVKKPTVTVTDSNGKKISSSNYTVTYESGRKYVGEYSVKIKFKGNYSGTVTKYFKIYPMKTKVDSLKKDKKAITVKWDKVTKQITGYQIQYSTSSKFTESTTKSKKVEGYKTSSKKLTGLKANKKYYVRVRVFKTVDGTTYYSGWSDAKSTTTK